jgi:Domain of unknown function (DUF4157)
MRTFAHHVKRPQDSTTSRLADNDWYGGQHGESRKANWHFGATQPDHFDFSRIPIQPKLTMGQPGDALEQEAERAAAAVMGGSQLPEPAASARSSKPVVQRGGFGKSEGAIAAPQGVHSGLRSSSQPLEGDTRQFMESRFAHDFSQVRVHANSEAAEASRSAGAQAYTVGSHIVFGAEQYQPKNRSGRELIAHELTHVLQQRGGEPLVQRRILYPDPTVTLNDDPIPRYLRNDDSLALTTITINGKDRFTDEFVRNTLKPRQIGTEAAPAAPAKIPGSGSGSGSGGQDPWSGVGSGGGTSPLQCSYNDFDISISANIRLPHPPDEGRWGPEVIKRGNIGRPGLPPECKSKDQISVVIKGDPNSNDFYTWITANEQEHARDFKRASEQILKPYQLAVLALRGAGADAYHCTVDLNRQLSNLSPDNIGQNFLHTVGTDITGRDVPGGHKFDSQLKQRNNCDNLEILLKKSPVPARGRHP